MLFYQWYAAERKGKLDRYSAVRTLEWEVGGFAYICVGYYRYKISKETIDEVRNVSISFSKVGE